MNKMFLSVVGALLLVTSMAAAALPPLGLYNTAGNWIASKTTIKNPKGLKCDSQLPGHNWGAPTFTYKCQQPDWQGTYVYYLTGWAGPQESGEVWWTEYVKDCQGDGYRKGACEVSSGSALGSPGDIKSFKVRSGVTPSNKKLWP